ncbi:HD-GYP domain-containing protein [Geopsychrobacter electrodiphilus]|uniref:HD-GYP domain-containing protein n=1 Tax=Geopsychrobacter electrodiphilus TaxID=225196 RepID=UPI00036CBF2C|nr:HD domain-containing phosphohydrolase [Geopsychrobacter electrodiphilus]
MGNKTFTCSFCSAEIDRVPFARQGDSYCCEGCFLKQQEFQTLKLALDEAHLALPEALVMALDEREHQTGLHSKRVACHTLVLAQHFTTDAEMLRQVYWGALLHDIGKIGIPDAVLLKRGALSPKEWMVMRSHPQRGHAILAGLPFLTGAAEIVRSHQEKFDGSGYPRGLVGEAIPWGARVFAVIDTLDAMTSDRPYRQGCSFDQARIEILQLRGSKFDPRAVEAFLAEETTLRNMVALKCGKLPIDAEEFRKGM